LLTLGERGVAGADARQFNRPTAVAVARDSSFYDASGNVYVADRENQRIQVFDSVGHYLTQWAGKQLGRPYAIAIDKRGTAYIADGGDQPDSAPDRSAWVLARLDGTPLLRVGRFGNYDGQFEMAHSIAVDGNGDVYVGDITGARVQKFEPSGAAAGRAGHGPKHSYSDDQFELFR
jgi:DNA-binding beta-propeller fold protein YncE